MDVGMTDETTRADHLSFQQCPLILVANFDEPLDQTERDNETGDMG